MEMQHLYLVLGARLEIEQLVLLIVFLVWSVMVGLYSGKIIINMLTSYFYPRQLQPEPEKSVDGEVVGTKVDEEPDKVLQRLPFTFEQKQLNSNTAKFVGDPHELPQFLEKSDFFKKKNNQPRHKAEDLAIGYLSNKTDPSELYPWYHTN
jgi:hypothetical protein